MIKRPMLAAIRIYQMTFGAVMPPVCRYTPSCSRYAAEAIEVHGAMRGGWLALKRLGRCNPWGGLGYDPVPERKSTG